MPNSPSTQFIEKVRELCEKCYGHPLAITNMAKSYIGRGINEITEMMQYIQEMEISNQPVKRFQNIKKCFDYTYNKMGLFIIALICNNKILIMYIHDANLNSIKPSHSKILLIVLVHCTD